MNIDLIVSRRLNDGSIRKESNNYFQACDFLEGYLWSVLAFSEIHHEEAMTISIEQKKLILLQDGRR
jgi:hypothetical protein